ncbi:MAG: alanine--glyoxylate aminotransferase family protein [Gemmatimonadetes bacterium]|nr:alanine--glyoxylate aminotransferase family protein [Gemmatimonadota bacterium]
MSVSSLEITVGSLIPRLLLGPGPSPVSPRVLQATARPTLGHLDPQFLALLDDVNERLRGVFGTRNQLTFPISGTGSAGMEAALVNVLEPGDTAIIGVQGFFGERMTKMATRMGAKVVAVEVEWGKAVEVDRLIEAHKKHPAARLLGVVHAETSTGACRSLEDLGAYLRDHDTLFVVDAVTSLGGMPVEVDQIGIDICYSGTQKCIGALPGLAPITFSPRASKRAHTRKIPSTSWYLDVSLIENYIGAERRYHHTAPINLFYALHEALRELDEEGLQARYERHARVGTRVKEELYSRGFIPFTDPSCRLAQLTAVELPGRRDEAPLRAQLLELHGIEVGGGLGPVKGKIWRVGLMGHGAHDESIDRLLAGVDQLLGS